MHNRLFSRSTLFLFIISVSFGLGSCGNSGKSGVSEGIIEYDAEAVDKSHPMADLAPSKMTVKFKDDKSIVELQAGMGLFSTTFISDPETFTMIQLVKLLNKKYVHTFDTIELNEEHGSGPKMVIEKTNETKVIAKYNCKKAIAKFPGTDIPPFDIYYTNEIAIENPNWSNPFKEIDGVLMEYQMKRHGMELRFTARTVSQSEVDDELFEVPEDYKQVDKSELDKIFEAFQ